MNDIDEGKGIVKLPNRLSVYIPSKRLSAITSIEDKLLEQFGGFTEYYTIGNWISGNGAIPQKEEVVILTSYFSEDPKDYHVERSRINVVFQLAKEELGKAGEKELAFELNNALYLVKLTLKPQVEQNQRKWEWEQ